MIVEIEKEKIAFSKKNSSLNLFFLDLQTFSKHSRYIQILKFLLIIYEPLYTICSYMSRDAA